MAKQYPALTDELIEWIGRQRIFFTATATAESRVNLSPREGGAFRVVDPSTVIYLDRTGSGNETAAHLRADGRMTVMFCAVEGPPQILRLYGQGRIVDRRSGEFADLLAAHYDGAAPPGARQIVRLDVDLAQTSCGFGVPLFDYQRDRDVLTRWATAKGPDGLEAYWREKNTKSIDGLPTGIFEDAAE